jgi:hypothetical protein
MKPYLDQSPTDRAMEAKEWARLAVADYYQQKELSRAIPTVLRDIEGREGES